MPARATGGAIAKMPLSHAGDLEDPIPEYHVVQYAAGDAKIDNFTPVARDDGSTVSWQCDATHIMLLLCIPRWPLFRWAPGTRSALTEQGG